MSLLAFLRRALRVMVILRRCPKLEQQLQQFSQNLAMQATQIAARNRLHEVDERLAKTTTFE
jgi:hypothetical protein